MEKALEEMKNDISDIKRILIGNGKIGVAEMARRSFEWMQHQSKTKNGLLDWAFRVFIMIMIGFMIIYLLILILYLYKEE